MSFDADHLPPLRDVISQNGLRAEKAFGQNFLLDLNITRKITRQASDLDDKIVIEIGPGPGGLTRALLESDAHKVIAIEFDPRCIEALKPLVEAANGRLELIHADALTVNIADFAQRDKQIAILANLPYNIATPLLISWLRTSYSHQELISEMVLMFQKEVGDRITAAPHSKAYGRLSVISQWLCECREAIKLPPEAFTPPPKIHSSVVHFKPKAKPQNVSFESIEMLTAAAFGQRRKMIRQSLKAYRDLFQEAGIEETARAEALSIDDFLRLASLIKS